MHKRELILFFANTKYVIIVLCITGCLFAPVKSSKGRLRRSDPYRLISHNPFGSVHSSWSRGLIKMTEARGAPEDGAFLPRKKRSSLADCHNFLFYHTIKMNSGKKNPGFVDGETMAASGGNYWGCRLQTRITSVLIAAKWVSRIEQISHSLMCAFALATINVLLRMLWCAAPRRLPEVESSRGQKQNETQEDRPAPAWAGVSSC